MKKEKTKKTWWQRLLIILACVIGFVCIVLFAARLYFRLPVQSYYNASEATFEIPDIHSGFIAQGLCFQDGKFYATGYMNDGSASPIYVVDKDSEQLEKTVYMKDMDGSDFHGHCGGLSVHGDMVYVANSTGLNVYSLTDIGAAADRSFVSPIGTFSTEAENGDYVGVACTAIWNDYLVLGEFYREANYKTPENHKLTTPAGDYNQALAVVYAFDPDAPLGLSTTPALLFSLTDQIQGMEFKDNHMYLSSSYAVAKSHIYEYDIEKMIGETRDFMGQPLLTLYADSAALLNDFEIAPMSEEIVFVDDKLYTMCESASNKYIFGKFTSAKYVYATDFTKMN